MSLILVKDNTNSKIRELECTTAGLLKVDHVDVSALATESSLASLNGKVTVCDTSSISGTVACTHASLPLPTGAATQATLASLNGKVVACDTGAVVVSASSLPTGAATEASLAVLSGCVTAGKVAVSSSAALISATSAYVFGTQGNPVAELSNIDAISSVVDVDAFQRVLIAGKTTKFDSEFQIEVSGDNLDWFDLQGVFVNVDYANGNFGVIFNTPFQYLRLKRLADVGSAGSESVSAIISGK